MSSASNNTNGMYQDLSYKFNASMAIIVVVLVATFFFMTLFVLYIRRCNLATVADLGWATGGYPPPLAGQLQQQQQQQQQGQNPNRHGVAPEVLAKLPILRYASIKSTKKGKAGTECVVCLLAFEEAEEVRVLPACGHGFHTECIDMWLETHSTCPLCRRSINSEPDLQRTPSAVMNSLRREPDPAASDRTLAPSDPLPEESEPGQDVEQEAVSRTLSKNSESFRLAEHELELMEVREKLRSRSRRVQSSRSMRFTNPMPAHQEHESGSPSPGTGQASPALRRSVSDGQSFRIWVERPQQQRPPSGWSLNKSFRSFKSWLPNQR